MDGKAVGYIRVGWPREYNLVSHGRLIESKMISQTIFLTTWPQALGQLSLVLLCGTNILYICQLILYIKYTLN